MRWLIRSPLALILILLLVRHLWHSFNFDLLAFEEAERLRKLHGDTLDSFVSANGTSIAVGQPIEVVEGNALAPGEEQMLRQHLERFVGRHPEFLRSLPLRGIGVARDHRSDGFLPRVGQPRSAGSSRRLRQTNQAAVSNKTRIKLPSPTICQIVANRCISRISRIPTGNSQCE